MLSAQRILPFNASEIAVFKQIEKYVAAFRFCNCFFENTKVYLKCALQSQNLVMLRHIVSV